MTGQPLLFPLSPVAAARPAGELAPRDLMRLLFKHSVVILASVIIVALLAFVLYSMQRPVYSSVARVWVKTEQGSPSFLSGVTAYREPLYPDPVNRRIETEMELMITRTSAASVVQATQMRSEQLPGSPLGVVLSVLSPPKQASTSNSNAMVDGFLKNVFIEPLRSKTADTTSNILEVRFDSTDPSLAPKALDRLLENYLSVAATQNRRLGEEAVRALSTEVDQSRAELLALDEQIVALAARNTPRGASGDADSANGKRSRSKDAREAQDSSAARRLRDNTFAGATVGNEQALASLKTQTVEMQAELDALRELYTDDAENVKNLRRRLEAMQRRLADGLTANVKASSNVSTLERQRLLAQERYTELQRKLDQIKLYLRLNPSDAESRVIVDAPSKPQSNEGKRKPILLLAGPVIGLLLGLLLAGLRELFDQRLQSRRDVQSRLGLPVLGALPRFGAAERQRLAGAR